MYKWKYSNVWNWRHFCKQRDALQVKSVPRDDTDFGAQTGTKRTLEQSGLAELRPHCINPLTPIDLQRRRALSTLKIKIHSKNMRENQQIQQLLIQFINYVW
jgi:hypothetical protein